MLSKGGGNKMCLFNIELMNYMNMKVDLLILILITNVRSCIENHGKGLHISTIFVTIYMELK